MAFQPGAFQSDAFQEAGDTALSADTFTANSRQRIGVGSEAVEGPPMQRGLPASDGIGPGLVSGRRIGTTVL